MSIPTAQLEQIANTLQSQGYWVFDSLFAHDRLLVLSHYAENLAEDLFRPAGIGRGEAFQREPSQRSDRICWLSGRSPEELYFLNAMDQLRVLLNRQLYLGLSEYECHFARYAAGAFYKKHRDAFRLGSNTSAVQRKVSTVFYLNQHWKESDGGELVIYNDQDQKLETIQPVFGRFVIFLSEEFPHEVLPSFRERKSIAGWFRSAP